MYSSNPPFSQLTSSSSSTTLDHANFFPHHSLHEIFLPPNNHHLQDPFSDFYNLFPPNNAGPSPMTTFTDSAAAAVVLDDQEVHQDSVRAGLHLIKEDHLYPLCDPLGSLIATKKVTRAKKDRHTMIFTAQGLRHRRVRLSTDIAQKFFNLQDMLGFDKASQTLDWLFTNSKTAIQQLIELHNLSNSSSSISECELDVLLSSHTSKGAVELSEGSRRAMLNSKNKPAFICTSGKEKRSIAAHTDKLAKESREKARARARERTLEKQRIRKLNDISSASSEIVMPSLSTEAPWKDIILDAILTKKPLKYSSSPIYVYQQNMPVPEEIKFQSQLSSHY